MRSMRWNPGENFGLVVAELTVIMGPKTGHSYEV